MLKAQQLRHKNSALSTSKKLTLPETFAPSKLAGPQKRKYVFQPLLFKGFCCYFQGGTCPPKKKSATSASSFNAEKISPLFLDIPVKMLHALTVKVGAGI